MGNKTPWYVQYQEIQDATSLVIASIRAKPAHITPVLLPWYYLCVQANTIKTSYQESENYNKNTRRLWSACMQGFGVHFLYNYLMHFHQNEQIVKRQFNTLKMNAQGKGGIARDQFMRFTFVGTQSK